MYILSHVTRLSLLFQKEKIDFVQVQTLVHSCIEAVRQLESKPGPEMKSTDTVIQSLIEEHQITNAGVTEENKLKFQVAFSRSTAFNCVNRSIYYQSFQVFNSQILLTESDKLESYGEGYH